MAVNQLVHNAAANGVEVESATFFGELTMENHLKQKVAQFFDHLVVVAGFDGIEQFVNIL